MTSGAYLIQALNEAGPFKFTSDGDRIPLEWVDLTAYAVGSGAVSEPWELRTLLEMSRAYCRGLREGQKVLAKDPRTLREYEDILNG